MLGLSFSGQKRQAKESPDEGRIPVSSAPAAGDTAEKPLGAFDALAVPRPQPADPTTVVTPAAANALSAEPVARQDPSDIINALTRTKLDVADQEADPASPDAASNVCAPNAVVPMQVVVFTSQKGGSGKTTLCGQLSVAAEVSGNGPIALIDCDPQGSLSEWWNARDEETPLFVRTSVEKLGEDLEQLRMEGINLVFVDTPPSVTETIRKVVSHADLVVIPTRPSPHDLRAVGATLDIVDSNSKPLVFAVNGATKRARITADTAVALSQHGTVAPVTIHHRNDMATSMIKGGTVMETNPSSKSAQEITELWQYLFTRLRKSERRVGQRAFGSPEKRDPDRGRTFGGGATGRPGGFGRRAMD
jgi:chromosome partitioning protein